METYSLAILMRVKQQTVIKFLTAENVILTKIFHCLKAIYGDNAIDRFAVNRCVI